MSRQKKQKKHIDSLFVILYAFQKMKRGEKMLRKKLKEKIIEVYKTQDACSYALKIENGLLSRIINCKADPTGSQIKKLCNALRLTKKEVNEKQEAEKIND